MELYLSLSAYGGVSTREALTVFWDAGIRHVELAIGPKPDNDAVQAIQDFGQQGMVYRAHHAFVWGDGRSRRVSAGGCPVGGDAPKQSRPKGEPPYGDTPQEYRHYPFNLAQPQDWNYFQRLTDWLATNGITAYSVHGGHFPTVTDRAKAYATFLENVHYLHQLCQGRGIVLGVETMYPTLPTTGKEYLLDNASEVAQFCQDAPQIKIVVDLAHLNIWHHHNNSSKLQWLKLPPERLLEIHISDNDGRHDIHSRITQKTWWVSHVTQFPTVVPFVLESRLNRLPVSVVQQEYSRIAALISAASQE